MIWWPVRCIIVLVYRQGSIWDAVVVHSWLVVSLSWFRTLRILAVVYGRPRIPKDQSSLWILPPQWPHAPWPCLVGHVTKFLLILAGHLLSLKNIPVCLDHSYSWGAVGKAHGLIHRCVTPLSHPCHPMKSKLSCFQLSETLELHQGKRVSVPWAIGCSLLHTAYQTCCSKLLLQLL